MKNAYAQNLQTAAHAGAAVVLLLSMHQASAEDRFQFGVGASVNINSIFFPMRFNHVMVEPMYYVYDNTTGYPDGNGFYQQDKTTVLAVGIFALSPVVDDSKVEAYGGVRLGVMSVYRDRFSSTDNRQDDESSVIYEPTVGMQYFFTPRFSIAADVSYTFQHGSVDLTDHGQSYQPYDHDYSATHAKVIVRGYFN